MTERESVLCWKVWVIGLRLRLREQLQGQRKAESNRTRLLERRGEYE